MGEAYITRRGGGSELNFRVIGAAEQPVSPRENDIWVECEGMTGWVFSVKQPEEAAEGLVWLTIGTGSSVAFNALKKNGLTVYPVSASQYVGGAWVSKTAQSYQAGEWVDWWYNIVQNGVMIRDLSVIGKAWDSEVVDGGHNITITERDGYLSVKGGGKGFGAAYTEEDLTGKRSITIEGDFPVNEYSLLAVWRSFGQYITSNMVASVRLSATGATLDISNLSGKMLVGITTVYVNEWKVVNMYIE